MVDNYNNPTPQVNYRADITWLQKFCRKLFLRRSTRKQLVALEIELTISRSRLQAYATELSEWRHKVGGANYNMNGMHAKAIVQDGMRQRIGHGAIPIYDEEFRG